MDLLLARLALGAEVGAALGKDDALDRLAAVEAGLAGALEDAVLILKTARFAAGALIILDATFA